MSTIETTSLGTTAATNITPATYITVATCNLNQWAMDFDGNMERIYQSCVIAQQDHHAHYRLGPELEISGYGCEDHFYEIDTIIHSWESLCTLIERGVTDAMICDFGMPILHRSARYNCRVLVYKRQILLIRPKIALADNGNYRESRWFTAYQPPTTYSNQSSNELIVLPTIYQNKFQQTSAPFGIQSIQLVHDNNITIGCESCEELWTPEATHTSLALQGIDIIGNGSGSHHELRKLDIRLSLAIEQATKKCGGVYCYANQRGCDGGRLYYDGGAFIAVNGTLLAQASQFSLQDVEVISATIDIDDVRSYRAAIPSIGIQSATLFRNSNSYSPYIPYIGGPVIVQDSQHSMIPSSICEPRRYCSEEECCYGPACWLWDYLRRSGANGFLLPLSGGADSSAVATIVSIMCTMVYKEIQQHPSSPTADDCRRICHYPSATSTNDIWIPKSSQEIANHILHTTYMGTTNSSVITKSRARRLAERIGSYHLSISIDAMVTAVVSVFVAAMKITPQYIVHGGTQTEDLALQNIQARLRMVTAYLFAQLLPWARYGKGFLLVLGSANVDEGLRGYMTKYDCSSADLNPIGAICKNDLKKMLLWAAGTYDHPVLEEIAMAPPTAELRPNNATSDDDNNDLTPNQQEHSQLDEDEMGMSYDELGHFGKLRKLSRCGPVSMYRKLCILWNHLSSSIVAEKVKRFFTYYAINRHKMCIITPSYHAEGYSPDDNRYDLRQFLYNIKWTRQFAVIDTLAQNALDKYNSNQSKDSND
jgi:NAD+ synthase (glutamine-hydrolysing)